MKNHNWLKKKNGSLTEGNLQSDDATSADKWRRKFTRAMSVINSSA